MRRNKILIVDDDPKSQSLLARYVDHMGYESITASTGFEGIKATKNEQPDLVLLDIMMPDMSGFDVLSLIKSDPETFAVPVVMITALSDDQHRIRSKELGADDFITKPLSFQEIRGRINSIMRVRELHKELQFSQGVISTLTNYQENILLNFNLKTFDVDAMFNIMLKKVLWDSYGPTGPATIVIVFDDGTGWWRGKIYQIKSSHAESSPIAFQKTHDDTDLEGDSVRVMRISPQPMPAVGVGALQQKQEERLLTPAEIEQGFETENSVKIFMGEDPSSALHGTLLDAIGNVTSYIRYRSRQLLVVAANFDKELTEIDGQILKSLFVSMSALKTIANQMRDIESLFHYTVEALARAAEANDEDTFTHISRINKYSAVLAQSMSLDSQFIEDIGYMAQMHDVGKIQVDAAILRKNGRLSTEEFEKMKLHTVYGARIIGDHPRLRMAKQIAMSHHEKWDGSGYPLGLSGEEIPLSARIVAIVDVYDALRSRRPYKEPHSHDSAMEIITHGDDRTIPNHFDPVIKSAFVKINKMLDEIYNENEE